ncbi:MAG: C cytochrome precursor [Luteitalea sp.]|nr:C cytochrome precursor [Luteitalea sp.]
MRASPNVLIVSALAVSTLIGLGRTLGREQPIPERQVADRPIQLGQDGYAGSQSCQACHPSQYRTWYRSYHRTMTQVATPDTAVADFDAVTVDAVHGRPMRLQRTGGQLWAEFDDPDSNDQPERRSRITRPVSMITGSHHQQIYWYPTGQNRLLGQLPGAYLIGEQRWIPRRNAVLHSPGDPPLSETGHWNSTCIACHATHGKPQFDTPFGSRPVAQQIVDTTVAELGIACEACHGPSEQHAAVNRNPVRRYSLHLAPAPDAATVQPKRLDPRRSAEVCGQCHGVWEFDDPEDERHANSRGLPYRPGDVLADTRFVAQPTANAGSPAMQALLQADPRFITDSFWSDGMVRVTGREYNGLIESPCFKAATDPARTMTCMSCHAMHQSPDDPRPVSVWANDQLAPDMDGNAACVQCHQSLGANLTAHTKHAPESTGSSCYNCHMPYTSYGLLKTIRSHTISVPSVAESRDTGRPNACNLCHLDKPLSWTADNLARQYGTSHVPLEDDERTTAASVLWLLRGDAGQRAILAQALAWPPAQQASGTTWMAPYLAQLLNDPYDAVRFIADRSLRSLPGFASMQYEFTAPEAQRRDAQSRAMTIWDRERLRERRTESHLLLDSRGELRVPDLLRLIGQRNSRRMLLRE